MLSSIMKYIKCNKPNTLLLGRWKLKDDYIKETISVFWTNSDHCGDQLCGNVIQNKKILEQKLDKKNINNINK